jgi:hypothetical protein
MDPTEEEELGPDSGEGQGNGAVLGHGGEGLVDDAVPWRFDVEEERGTGVEAHVEDAEEGA